MMLNCDLGESFGAWTMPVDEKIMVYIDQANVACGYHAGDPLAIQKAIKLAQEHNVAVGAHPSYPDLQGFGRRSLAMSAEELTACLHYQIAALDGLTACQQVQLSYIKPHGALYNDMMRDDAIRHTVMDAVASYKGGGLPLMIQAHPDHANHAREAAERGIILMYEAFADRRYTDDGFLVSRRKAGAVLNEDEALKQAIVLMDTQSIVSENGKVLKLQVDSLCVHGDSPDAIAMAEKLRIEMTKRKLTQTPAGSNA